MSKIGKINISIPEKVKVALAGNILNIEGPLGKKSLNIDLDLFNLDIKDGKELLLKLRNVMSQAGRFPVKTKAGLNYHAMTDMTSRIT